METFTKALRAVDDFVWGPVMLILLVGTGIILTIRTRFLPWRNLGYAIKSTLSKEARKKGNGQGDISPFSALTTALAATIGTGNIVGVATAMVSGGPGALVWMWLSACFGLSSKFSECMLAIKYREVNEQGEMSGGPMYTMKKAFKHKWPGSILGWCFALFAVLASFGIGNLTQANSIATAISTTFHVPTWITGIVITILALVIIVGGIKSISKVSQFVVPFMAIIYIVAGIAVIIGNISNVPSGIAMIFTMAFSTEAVTGGVLGTVVASMMNAMRFGVARGVFSNEAGMGSAAITAAAATTDNPVRQAYINMTGTFWDTIVVCTITGLCIASSGVLGSRGTVMEGIYQTDKQAKEIVLESSGDSGNRQIKYRYECAMEQDEDRIGYMVITLTGEDEENKIVLTPFEEDNQDITEEGHLVCGTGLETSPVWGEWQDEDGNVYKFYPDGSCKVEELMTGSELTIEAFKSVLGDAGGWMVCICVALFAFSTILGWEYHGEKAFEYILGTHRFNLVYRIVFSLIAYIGATTALEIAWNFSDIANALMAVPNLICLLVLSGEIAKDMQEFQKVLKEERKARAKGQTKES